MKKKPSKIPYQEYQALKEKEAKQKFKITLYPLPVLIPLLIPLAIFFLAIAFYYIQQARFSE